MKLAANMRLRGARPEVALIAVVIDSVYARHGVDCVITSVVRDPNPNSLHDEGLALDVRLPSACEHLRPIPLPNDDLDEVVLLDLRRALYPHCDVVDERKPIRNPIPQGWGPHFHIEYDPKPPAKG